MIRPLALSLAALLAAPTALAGPRLILDAEPGGVTVVIDHQPDVVIVERDRRVRRTRRVVRSRGYDVRPVYEREVVVYDDCGRDRGWVPPGHRKEEWHHVHGDRGFNDHRHEHRGSKRWKQAKHKKHHKKHKRNQRGRSDRGPRFARF